VAAQRGGKLSEDVVVPVERLGEAIEAVIAIGERHGVPACSWGHAGDGNLHATFLVDARDPSELERASAAAAELFATAAAMGGSISGEHGLGLVKAGHLGEQWSEATLRLHRAVKQAIDPHNLMNPGKKI
jgi:FAD/FMN-containing dehydrogenase